MSGVRDLRLLLTLFSLFCLLGCAILGFDCVFVGRDIAGDVHGPAEGGCGVLHPRPSATTGQDA